LITYLKQVLKKTCGSLLDQPIVNIFTEGAPLKELTTIQQMFVRWNAERLNISIDESRDRYLDSWKAIRNGHRGHEFRLYNVLSHKLFRVFFDDSDNEIFDAYQFFGPMHFLRMLSYPESRWDDNDLVVQELSRHSKITILDFGCGLARLSRTLAIVLLQKGLQVHLVLADIPTLRKEFLLWLGIHTGITTTFLDCTVDNPIPELPICDVCFAIEFFEHVHNPLLYVDRIHAALNTNGLLITNIMDHKKEFMHVSPNLKRLRNRVQSLGYEEIRPYKLYRKKRLSSTST